MNQSISSLINPANRNENDLAYTVKQWTHYMDAFPFNIEDADARAIAYKSLCRWLIVTGERPKVTDIDAAILELIDVRLGSPEELHTVFAEENKESLLLHGFAYPVFHAAVSVPVIPPVVTTEISDKKKTKRNNTHKNVENSKSLFDDMSEIEDYRCASTPKDVSTGHTRDCRNGRDCYTWKTKTPVGPSEVNFDVDNYDEYMVCYDYKGRADPLMYHVDPAGEFNGFSPAAKDSGNPAKDYNLACMHDYIDIMDLNKCGLKTLKRYKSMLLKNGGKNK